MAPDRPPRGMKSSMINGSLALGNGHDGHRLRGIQIHANADCLIGDGDYAVEVANALANCRTDGLFVFTSSGSVYTENSGGIVDEESDVVFSEEAVSSGGSGTRAMGILRAEKAVLQHPGGIVIRLGGLYTL